MSRPQWIKIDRRTGAIMWLRRVAVADLPTAIPAAAAEYAEMNRAFGLGRPHQDCGHDFIMGVVSPDACADAANWPQLEVADAAFVEAARAAYAAHVPNPRA